MAAKTTKSSILAKYGDRVTQAVQAHANDELKYGIQPLPVIKNGVAKLVACEFGTSEKTKQDFWRAAGAIDSPESVIDENGTQVHVKDRQTSIVVMIDASDEEKFDASIKKITDELRKLAGPDLINQNPDASLEDLSETILAEAPYFAFSVTMGKEDPNRKDPKTGKPYPPRAFENWHGTRGLENYVPTVTEGEAVDKSAATPAAAPSKNGTTVTKPAAKPTAANEPAPKAKGPYPEVEFRDDNDLDSLRKRAEEGEEGSDDKTEAYDKLMTFATDNGWSQDEIDAADYDELMEMCKNKKEGEAPAEEKIREPKVKEAVSYAPPNPKKKDSKLKPVSCTVTKVDKKEFTANLKNLADTKKEYKDVSWADLIWDS